MVVSGPCTASSRVSICSVLLWEPLGICSLRNWPALSASAPPRGDPSTMYQISALRPGPVHGRSRLTWNAAVPPSSTCAALAVTLALGRCFTLKVKSAPLPDRPPRLTTALLVHTASLRPRSAELVTTADGTVRRKLSKPTSPRVVSIRLALRAPFTNTSLSPSSVTPRGLPPRATTIWDRLPALTRNGTSILSVDFSLRLSTKIAAAGRSVPSAEPSTAVAVFVSTTSSTGFAAADTLGVAATSSTAQAAAANTARQLVRLPIRGRAVGALRGLRNCVERMAHSVTRAAVLQNTRPMPAPTARPWPWRGSPAQRGAPCRHTRCAGNT